MLLRRELEHLGKFSRPERWVRRGWLARKPAKARRTELRRFRRVMRRVGVAMNESENG